MSYEKAGDILRDAYKNGYAVAAFNIFNYETIKWAIMAAEKVEKPVLIEFYPGWTNFISLDMVECITRKLAEKAKVPVGLHLDHCRSYEVLMQAMQAGFMSVMYDGSSLPYEENVAGTYEVVKVAKALGIDVEAELGHVGSAQKIEDMTDTTKFTDVSKAKDFTERTGISSLAVSIGNAHGNYVRLPELDFERLESINKALGIPLVLHGGSGIPDEQVKKAVKRGIAKMNVATDFHHAYYMEIKGYMDKKDVPQQMFACSEKSEAQVVDYLTGKINLLNDK
jgi:ketose-bisphosphate aldolase